MKNKNIKYIVAPLYEFENFTEIIIENFTHETKVRLNLWAEQDLNFLIVRGIITSARTLIELPKGLQYFILIHEEILDPTVKDRFEALDTTMGSIVSVGDDENIETMILGILEEHEFCGIDDLSIDNISIIYGTEIPYTYDIPYLSDNLAQDDGLSDVYANILTLEKEL